MSKATNNKESNSLKAVIFDWAGTTVDFGCFAPTGVFVEVFRQKGIDITIEEARGPMGMHKRDHIRVISALPRIQEEWKKRYHRLCSEEDIEEMFTNFIPLQLQIIEKYSETVPELSEALEAMQLKGLKIGSTTGYNNEMMEILIRLAARQGYQPDAVVCATDVSAGRPAPWMAFKNAELLQVYPMHHIVKIGDTVADIREGINAGMWSVGVVQSSNEMGHTRDEILAMPTALYKEKFDKVKKKFLNAGAHYVIDTLAETDKLIDTINERLLRGEKA
ncbi:MAG: phosphonoacetaldehyde hydrolase [Bacteroidetes bacterium]|nr:MAG: phosphonoacetaldehyde hydrolase [Bacteroidota bacterium]